MEKKNVKLLTYRIYINLNFFAINLNTINIL